MLNINKQFALCYFCFFFLAQIVLGVFIQLTSDLTYSILSLSSVVLCFITAVIFFKRSRNYILTIIALFTTVCADLFLCDLFEFENIKVVAMLFFCLTQICYFLRIYFVQENISSRRFHLIIRLAVSTIAIAVTFFVLKDNANALAVITVFYFSNLLLNLGFAFSQFKRAPLFAIGLLIFCFCDILIGFEFLGDFLPVSETSIITKITDIDLNLAWVFYVPSQTLIATDIALNKNNH